MIDHQLPIENPYLVAGVDESVCNNNVLSASCCKDNDLCNIIWSERLTTTRQGISQEPDMAVRREILRIDGVRLGLVTVEADNGEFLVDIRSSEGVS